MCIEHEAEEKALRDYLGAIDAEEWEAERVRQGIPHPCDDCEDRCTKSCRFWPVRKENSQLHPIFRDILDVFARR